MDMDKEKSALIVVATPFYAKIGFWKLRMNNGHNGTVCREKPGR